MQDVGGMEEIWKEDWQDGHMSGDGWQPEDDLSKMEISSVLFCH